MSWGGAVQGWIIGFDSTSYFPINVYISSFIQVAYSSIVALKGFSSPFMIFVGSFFLHSWFILYVILTHTNLYLNKDHECNQKKIQQNVWCYSRINAAGRMASTPWTGVAMYSEEHGRERLAPSALWPERV